MENGDHFRWKGSWGAGWSGGRRRQERMMDGGLQWARKAAGPPLLAWNGWGEGEAGYRMGLTNPALHSCPLLLYAQSHLSTLLPHPARARPVLPHHLPEGRRSRVPHCLPHDKSTIPFSCQTRSSLRVGTMAVLAHLSVSPGLGTHKHLKNICQANE